MLLHTEKELRLGSYIHMRGCTSMDLACAEIVNDFEVLFVSFDSHSRCRFCSSSFHLVVSFVVSALSMFNCSLGRAAIPPLLLSIDIAGILNRLNRRNRAWIVVPSNSRSKSFRLDLIAQKNMNYFLLYFFRLLFSFIFHFIFFHIFHFVFHIFFRFIFNFIHPFLYLLWHFAIMSIWKFAAAAKKDI